MPGVKLSYLKVPKFNHISVPHPIFYSDLSLSKMVTQKALTFGSLESHVHPGAVSVFCLHCCTINSLKVEDTSYFSISTLSIGL